METFFYHSLPKKGRSRKTVAAVPQSDGTFRIGVAKAYSGNKKINKAADPFVKRVGRQKAEGRAISSNPFAIVELADREAFVQYACNLVGDEYIPRQVYTLTEASKLIVSSAQNLPGITV